MGRHDRPADAPEPTLVIDSLGGGRHADDPLDLDRPDHHQRNVAWAIVIVLTLLAVIMGVGGRLFASDPKSGPAAGPRPLSVTETSTVTETETIDVPGPTITRTEPGPTVFRTPAPMVMPGPTVTVPVPGPTVTVTVTVPGPTKIVTKTTPGPTVTVPGPTVTKEITVTVCPRRKC